MVGMKRHNWVHGQKVELDSSAPRDQRDGSIQLGLAKRTQSCATDGAETKLGDSLIKPRTLKRTTKQSAASFGSGRTCNDRHTLSAAIVPTGAGVASPVHGVNFAAFIGIRLVSE
ncbi:hypothetical protein MGG_15932 [Pyricularia oryzae 70-15]|uniref:Uncharacterized protein n=1 Tax=Pyricularia oryzae (strain 70-15 / ATCC MYA-4617 / FGSC 8958) TaxID=242507 RepID=G4MWC7_PYRO7|nr:uncharacterized protein MGG_15932 [Pyricularia oryzae 70-15]EHA55887.1 hypothetical protein MGG_15932 [Pyricularia oryzae 70-15]